MTLLQIIREEAGSELTRLFVLANLAGLANAVILTCINAAATDPGEVQLMEVALFGVLIAIYGLSARHVNERISVILEAALQRIKLRVGRSIIRVELDGLEQIRAAEICDRVTENTTFISDRATLLASVAQAIPIVVFVSIYIAYLSLPALALLGLILGIAASMFLAMRREFVRAIRHTARLRIVFFERLADLLSGFKQLKFNRQAAVELGRDIEHSSKTLEAAGIRSSTLLADNMMLSNGLAFALLAAVTFILHYYVALDWPTLASLIAAGMFMRAPIFTLSAGMMPYIRANVALAEIAELEQKIETVANFDQDDQANDPWAAAPTRLQARSLEYTYPGRRGEKGFHIGPFDLQFDAGEIVFIVGGNGSGKSTLLKTLIGLYPASAGTIELDGLAVDGTNRAGLRERITAIFSDFHLFPRLYGLEHIDGARIAKLLTFMRLDRITRVVKGEFTRLRLSTGQRKRVAMIVAMLEDRPICVFDEWPADQDPGFRRIFYEELLPELKRAGKIVIIVSHDDRYFDRADRILTLEYGKLRSVHPPFVDSLDPPSVHA